MKSVKLVQLQILMLIIILIFVGFGCSSGGGDDKKSDDTNTGSSGTPPPPQAVTGTTPVIGSAMIEIKPIKSSSDKVDCTCSLVATDPDLDMKKLHVKIVEDDTGIEIGSSTVDLPAQTSAEMSYSSVAEVALEDGSWTIELQVEDSKENKSTSFTIQQIINGNSSPVAVDDNTTTEMNTNITVDVITNDTDVDEDDLSVYEILNQVGGTFVNNNDGTITAIPDTNFSGDASCDYIVTDGTETDAGTLTVTVTELPNNVPVAVDDTATTTVNTNVTIEVLSNDTDIDGDKLSISEILNQTNGTFVDNGNGTIFLSPEINFTGIASCNYTVTDGTDTDTGILTVIITEPQNNHNEISLFNSSGIPIAYIAEDYTIYLWSGEPVAYLYDDSGEVHIYGFNGDHLGWFVSNIIYDHEGDAVGATKEAFTTPVASEPYKPYKKYKPYKSYREYAPYQPYLSNDWSDIPLSVFLGQEVPLYNSSGTPIAYISEGYTIYLYSGEPVVYLYNDSGEVHIYGFNGDHLGWFVSNIIYDHEGDVVGATKEAFTTPVASEPYKSYKNYEPYKSYREYAPYQPYLSNDWSDISLNSFLLQGEK